MWGCRVRSVIGWLVFSAASLADPAPLSGVVTSEGGWAIEGARVVIWTGEAINEVPLLCPSCYADCSRAETTDDEGSFFFEDVDDEVAFRLVIVADGHHPLHTAYVTPGQEPRTFQLRPRETVEDPSRLIRGRVVDVEGRPIADAIVDPQLWWFEGRRGGSHLDGSDPFAFTGADGRFEIAAGSPVHGAMLHIQGPVMAPAYAELVRSGLALEDQPDITLHTGVTVNGRLLGTDGQPLPDVTLNLRSVSRQIGVYYGPVTYGTDEDGRFSFQNVPANMAIEIVGGMVELRGHGVPEARLLTTGDNDSTIDVGDIHLEPGHTIRGRVVLSDGNPLPRNGRKIEFGARGDLQRADVDDNGSFMLQNVPAGEARLSVQMPGYHISRWNPNRDQYNWSLIGVVRGDIDDFVVLLEPGIERQQAASRAFRSGEQVPTLHGIDEPLPASVGGRLRPISIDPRVAHAEGWKTHPWQATVTLPADTTADNPRTIEVSASDPTRPYLPAQTWTIEATHEIVGLEWPEELSDARVLLLELREGENRLATLVDLGFPGMSRFVLHEPQQTGETHVSLGRVLDASGQPIADARVTPVAYWKQSIGRSPWPGGTRMTTTDVQGRFGVSATEAYDRVQVRITASGHADQQFDVVPDERVRELVLTQPAALSMVALDAAGEPARHAVATLWRQNTSQSWMVIDFATADKAGSITFEHAPSGERLRVIIEDAAADPDTAWSVIEVEPIQRKARDLGTITAVQTALIKGQLVARDDLDLWERPALVLHRMATDERYTVWPDDDGQFAFPPVPAGDTYAVTYHGPGYLHPAHGATIQGFAAGSTAVGGRLDGDTFLRLMIEPTWDGGESPQFTGQDRSRPFTSVTERGQTR